MQSHHRLAPRIARFDLNFALWVLVRSKAMRGFEL